MKKIIVLAIALMALVPVMDAQIVINKSTKVETIKSWRMGWVSLTRHEGWYSLCLKSDNQFDHHYIIVLGEQEKAEQSLQTLIDLASTIDKEETIEFENGHQTIRAFKGAFKGELWFKADGYAGYGKTSKMELEMVMKALKKQ